VSPNYSSIIAKRIYDRTAFTKTGSEHLEVEYLVELFPDGSVKEIRLQRSSGSKIFDDAVKTGIIKASPFPADQATGKVPGSMLLKQRLYEN
jgi:colicin import membrane protein